MKIISKLKWYVKVVIFKKLFPFWQRLGVHLTRVHYYEPIPDTRQLGKEIWEQLSQPVGIEFNEQRQVELLGEFVARYKSEYDAFPRNASDVSDPYQYYTDNGSFLGVDGEILYCMIRHFKPRRIVEIGSGNTTLVSA